MHSIEAICSCLDIVVDIVLDVVIKAVLMLLLMLSLMLSMMLSIKFSLMLFLWSCWKIDVDLDIWKDKQPQHNQFQVRMVA